MKNLALKFDTKAQADALLFKQVNAEKQPKLLQQQPELLQQQPVFRNTDVIGVIYKPTGEVTVVDGIETPVMQALQGWHVNVLALDEEDTTAIEVYKVEPSTPVRVWG